VPMVRMRLIVCIPLTSAFGCPGRWTPPGG
jgi:hypothetical protein